MKTLNVPKAGIAKQAGFTIIELIVVILLLGILAATALPRFIDVTDEAHAAAFDGVLAGYSTGMVMGRAQWIANGQPATAITSFGPGTAFANTSGVIIGLNATANEAGDCKEIFDVILQGGRPTTIADTDVGTSGAGLSVVIGEVPGAIGTNEWFTMTDITATECEYYYGGAGVASGDVVPGFTLNTGNGEITTGTVTL